MTVTQDEQGRYVLSLYAKLSAGMGGISPLGSTIPRNHDLGNSIFVLVVGPEAMLSSFPRQTMLELQGWSVLSAGWVFVTDLSTH